MSRAEGLLSVCPHAGLPFVQNRSAAVTHFWVTPVAADLSQLPRIHHDSELCGHAPGHLMRNYDLDTVPGFIYLM